MASTDHDGPPPSQAIDISTSTDGRTGTSPADRDSASPPPAVPEPLNEKPRHLGLGQLQRHTSPSQAQQVTPWAGPSDPSHPYNLSPARKWLITILVSHGAACVASTSSIYASADPSLQAAFDIPHELSVLGLSLFLLGLGLGPLLLAPLSEFYGRRGVFVVSYSLFVALQIPTPLAKNVVMLVVPRFFAAVAGSAFLTVAGGTVSDMWDAEGRAAPMAVFTASPFLGTVVGPVMGGFLCEGPGWEWAFWVMLFWSVAVLVGVIFFLPETYTVVLSIQRARLVRSSGADPTFLCEAELARQQNNRTPLQAVLTSCTTPFRLLFHEPIISFLNTWTAVLMGILYLFFAAFPKVFTNVYGFPAQLTGLTFLGIGIGMVISLLSQPYWKRRYDAAKLRTRGGAATPEMRLVPSMLGGVLAPLGVFWFAGTISKSVHWSVPVVAGVPFGLGVVLCFISVQAYLVDAYPLYAASALACHIFMRTTLAAIFPLFEARMYERLGYQWASALLGFLILIMVPLPFVFAKYGARIRAASKFTNAPSRGDVQPAATAGARQGAEAGQRGSEADG